MHTPWMVKRKANHTPDYSHDGKLIVMDTRQFYIASIHADADAQDEVGPEEQLNYAHLIAAAPAMYEALQKVLSCFAPEDNDVTAQAVRNAINVAEGKDDV